MTPTHGDGLSLLRRRRFLAGSVGLLASSLAVAGCTIQPEGAGPPGTASPSETSGPTTPASPSIRATPTAGPGGGTPSATRPILAVTDFGADTVTFIDPSRSGADADLGSVPVGTAPYGITLGRDGLVWVAAAEGVAVVDTAGRRRVALIPYRTGSGAVTTGEYRGGGMGIAVSPDGGRAYVGVNVPGRSGVVEVIDTTRHRVVRTVPIGRRPFDVDVSSDGRWVFATNHDSYDVTIIDTGNWRTRTVLVDPYDTGRSLGAWLKPHYAVVRPSDGALLLPFEGEKLLAIDPASGDVTIAPMTADTHQHGVAITGDGTLFVVGTGGTSDSGNGPSLTIRAPDGAERVVPLDGPHETVAVSADGATAYVTGGFTRDGYWDGISIVDVTDGTVTRLGVGQRPLGIVLLDR